MTDQAIRKDLLKDRWVLFSINRGKRPFSFIQKRNNSYECVFCPGNEHLTPPATLVLSKDEKGFSARSEVKSERIRDWSVRVVPNLYPAMRLGISGRTRSGINRYTYPARGHHEIIVESPRHFQRLEGMSLTQLQNMLSAYRDRAAYLYSKSYVEYISIFRNYKREAGASQRHPHSQLVTLPFVPSIIEQELESLRRYSVKRRGCLLCNLIKEKNSNKLIWKGSFFTVLSPRFSASPYEFWIIPNRHSLTFLDITRNELSELSLLFKSSFSSLSELLNDPPYNYWIHTSPKGVDDYHWHIEIVPKLGVVGGLEQSTAVFLNCVLPEQSAFRLRKILLNKIKAFENTEKVS